MKIIDVSASAFDATESKERGFVEVHAKESLLCKQVYIFTFWVIIATVVSE